MLNWLVRLLMAVSGVVAGWFVARDSGSFGVVQLTVSLLLIVFCILVAIYWPSLLAIFKSIGRPENAHRKNSDRP